MKPSSQILCLSLFILVAFHACTLKENNQKIAETEPKVETNQAAPQPGFVHAVYFWLKKDNPDLVKEFIDQGLPKLAEIPSIQSVTWGPPAGTPREVVDNSYDLAWIVNFENAEEQDNYQVDPLHVEFVEKYKSIFEKVQVYDNVVHHYVAD